MPQYFVPCAFCGGKGVSKEHVFPEWIQDIIPPKGDRTEHLVDKFAIMQDGSRQLQFRERGMLDRPGDGLTSTIRRFCETCNNGWMSRIVEAAKPSLKRLIRGDDFVPNRSQRLLLSRYAALTTAVIDQAEPRLSGISQSERSHLMVNRDPPEDWLIWHAFTRGPSSSAFWHRGLGLPIAGEEPTSCNATITMWHIGFSLFIVATEGKLTRAIPKVRRGERLGTQLWPIRRRELKEGRYFFSDGGYRPTLDRLAALMLGHPFETEERPKAEYLARGGRPLK